MALSWGEDYVVPSKAHAKVKVVPQSNADLAAVE